jgi:hypothetical protein
VNRGGTAQAQANAQQSNLATFLRYAPRVPLSAPLVGTLATGAAGGSTSLFNFANDIPAVPFWCSEISITTTMVVILTNGATASQTVIVSPFAPYCFFSSQLTLAGAPPWALMEHTPWYLDLTFSDVGWAGDPGYLGLGNNSTSPFTNTVDQGASANAFAAAPGATVTVTGSGTVTHTWTWTDRIILQRRRKRLFGAIPFGDPKNRPQFKMQLNPLIGTNPEQNAYVTAGANITAATSGTTTSVVVFVGHRLDVLPPGVAVPEPTVGMGLTVDSFSPAIQNAGSIFKTPHQDAMLYQAIHHLLINNQLPIRADYWSLWLTEEQKSARWEYDNAQNTFDVYFREFWETWDRYPIKGHYMANFVNGEQPIIPSDTPYEAFVTPDYGYAQAFGIVPTPNMQTAIRVPSGTSMSGAYIRNYSFGLVTVPY